MSWANTIAMVKPSLTKGYRFRLQCVRLRTAKPRRRQNKSADRKDFEIEFDLRCQAQVDVLNSCQLNGRTYSRLFSVRTGSVWVAYCDTMFNTWAAIWGATRKALAAIVRLGLIAPLRGMNEASTT
jgi:hypothetical protein